ncbi:MAG: flagellar biosynthetic protein FliO [Nitrospirota bacterium]
MDLTESFFKMASSLVVVLALMLLAAAAARRWLRPMLSGGASIPTIRLATSLALGSRRSVLVLEVAGRTLVIGATPQQLVLLTQFDHPASEAVVAAQFVDAGVVRPEPVKESQVPVYARVSEAIRNHQTRVMARSKP